MKKLLFTMMITLLCISLIGCGTKDDTSSSKILSNAEFNEDDYYELVQPNNTLGFQLLSTAPKDNEGNLFISPTSLLMALAMVYNGADGKTKEEMAKILGQQTDQVNKANASLINRLLQTSDNVELAIANSIWLNENYQFQDDFKINVQDYFNAEINEINVTDNESVTNINNWVKKETNGKINEIVQDPLDPDLVSILLNAIYFKGDWKYEFDKNQTSEDTFYGQTKSASFMKLEEELSYLENNLFQAVSLPYGDGTLSMKVFLPKKNVSLKEVEDELTQENWQKWSSQFTKKEGTLLLPKFKLEYEIELNDALKMLGMPTAFEKDADFSNMIQESVPLWISKVKQKTYIDVNEKGTEAAAATSIEVVTESAIISDSFYMNVNHPFIFSIVDDETGMILFLGSISSPKN
ncbi:serpin family protein [Lysinibacillus telephonicus]|uniref:serpin family protein n=1 Tax=Lysinibacillus telephonicus TaxID=1714840 RepID=UPI0037D26506